MLFAQVPSAMTWSIVMLSSAVPSKPAVFHRSSHSQSTCVTCFSIVADADPSVLPRILDLVAMFNLIPERCHVARSESETERPLLIDLQIADLADEDRHRLQKKLERMHLCTQILCSEKRRAVA
jgi:hypothetical protein